MLCIYIYINVCVLTLSHSFSIYGNVSRKPMACFFKTIFTLYVIINLSVFNRKVGLVVVLRIYEFSGTLLYKLSFYLIRCILYLISILNPYNFKNIGVIIVYFIIFLTYIRLFYAE